MSDPIDVEVAVDEDGFIPGNGGHGVIRPYTPERAKEMQAKKVAKSNARRREEQYQRRMQAQAVLGSGVHAAVEATDHGLTQGPLDKIAEKIVRMQATIILRGGEAFMPISLKEASEAAKIWESIATQERLKNRPIEAQLAGDDAADQVAKRVREWKRDLAKRQGDD